MPVEDDSLLFDSVELDPLELVASADPPELVVVACCSLAAFVAVRSLAAVLLFFEVAESAGSCPELSCTKTTRKRAQNSAAVTAATERRIRRVLRRSALRLLCAAARASR